MRLTVDDQCSLINDLRGGDHHKRTTVLAGVSHDERCLEAADEIEWLRVIVETYDEMVPPPWRGLLRKRLAERKAQTEGEGQANE